MNRKGFTLLELLVVIVIISVVTVSTIINFGTADDDTAELELKENYKTIQRGATIFLDMNDAWISQFTTKNEIFVRLSELQNQNFVSSEIVDPVTYDEIPNSYMVKIYVDKNTKNASGEVIEKVNTCILDIQYDTNGNEVAFCIANSNGEACECCDYTIGTSANPVCKSDD